MKGEYENEYADLLCTLGQVPASREHASVPRPDRILQYGNQPGIDAYYTSVVIIAEIGPEEGATVPA